MSIQQNYRNNPFHNFRHCFCVTQMVRVKSNCNALVLTSFRVFLSNNHYMYEHQEYEYEYAIQFYLTGCKFGASATTRQSVLACKISWGKTSITNYYEHVFPKNWAIIRLVGSIVEVFCCGIKTDQQLYEVTILPKEKWKTRSNEVGIHV